METAQTQQIKRFIDIALRRKALILVCILIGLAGGLAYYLSEPKIYQSTTLLSYQKQKINPGRMSPDLEGRIRDIVSTLTQIVTSRTSLEQIIIDVGLYEELRSNLPMQDVVEMMRRRIKINPSAQGDTFHISFFGSNPDHVVLVANSLAARFIEENLRYREERASETSAYTRDELDMAKEMLDGKESVMRDYKLQYYNEMPDQRANNMVRLNALQEQYQNRQESIQDLQRTRVLIHDQVAVRKEILAENGRLSLALNAGNRVVQPLESERNKLTRLLAELELLQEKYTDRHPAVKLLKKRIARLEQTIASESGTKRIGPDKRKVSDGQYDTVLFELQIQLKGVGLSIKKLNKEKEELKTSIGQYEKWVAAAPVREAEWSALTREYGEMKRHYDFLVSQNLQANSALNLERKQKGSQFKIEDPASRPGKPINPDFFKIMAIALLAGCGVGGAMALGLDWLDASFRNSEDLEHFLQTEVICSVPYLPLKKEIVRQRLVSVCGTIVFLLCGSAIIVACVYFWKQGMIIL